MWSGFHVYHSLSQATVPLSFYPDILRNIKLSTNAFEWARPLHSLFLEPPDLWKSQMLCFQVKRLHGFLDKWKQNTSKYHVVSALKSWNWLHSIKFWSLAGAKKHKTNLIPQTLGIFLDLFLRNMFTSVQNGKCFWIGGDRECEYKAIVFSILRFPITVPYAGWAKTYGIPSARRSWLGLMNAF